MDTNLINNAGAAQQVMPQQRQQPLQPTSAVSTSDGKSDNKQLAAQAAAAYAKAGDQVQLKYSATSKNLDTVRAIEQMHARLNELVVGVRQTNEGINQASETLDKMQSEAQTIVKNYPPFPLDSSDRQKILMSYLSLRKEMVKLMVPPPPTPVYEKVKKMWDALFDDNGQINSAAVPVLDASSSDKQVKDAAASISSTGEQLSELSNTITTALIQS